MLVRAGNDLIVDPNEVKLVTADKDGRGAVITIYFKGGTAKTLVLKRDQDASEIMDAICKAEKPVGITYRRSEEVKG